MDTIYRPEEFNCSEKLKIEEYFKKYAELLLEDEPTEANSKNKSLEKSLIEITGLDKQRINELQDKCSIQKLFRCDTDKSQEVPPDKIRSLYKLTDPHPITKQLKDKLKTVAMQDQLNRDKQLAFKYKEKIKQEFEMQITKPEDCSDENLELFKEVLVTVRIYHPFFHQYEKRNNCKNLRYSHEIVLLGSNTIADLRDNILCSSDMGICTEVEKPNDDVEVLCGKAKEEYPSGFIFIENVFYNDLRHKNAIDYSQVIRNWAEQKQIGKFKVAEMDKIKLINLTPRLGYPYVYQHQGDCEHIVVFSDIRLLQHSDPKSSTAYPYYQSVNRYISQICMICGLCTARWICVDCERLPHSRVFLCHDCLMSYNYVDGKKIGNFKVYPYFDRSTIL